MAPPDDPLESLLERMRAATPPQPSSVTREVWRRIADAECRPERPGILTRIELVFSQPAFAAAFIVACILSGLFLAEVRASRIHMDQSAQVEQHYLRLVDPLIIPSPAAQPASLRQ